MSSDFNFEEALTRMDNINGEIGKLETQKVFLMRSILDEVCQDAQMREYVLTIDWRKLRRFLKDY
jgi:hypothetical protein